MAIEVQVVSNSSAAQQDLAKLNDSVNRIGKTVEGLSNSLKGFASNIAATVISAGTLASLVSMSDTLTNINSKLKLATSSQNEFTKALAGTRQIALETRTGLEDTVSLYSKVAMSAKSLGASQGQVLKVTSSISKAIALSGANAAETSSAVLQLGQALASGRLQGDELRAMFESAPKLVEQIAVGMGKTVSEMRSLGAEGKLTSQDVFSALLKQTNAINASAKNIGVTFGAAMTNVKTAGIVLYDALLNYRSAESGGLSSGGAQQKTIAEKINDAALAVAKLGTDFEHTTLRMRVAFWKFASDAVDGINRIPSNLKHKFDEVKSMATDSVKGISNAIDVQFKGLKFMGFEFKLDTSKINLESFIPKLEPMRKLILDWCYSVERAFFWVYDRVIGHSWIPDLVEGVIAWTKKLLGDPLNSVKGFVDSTESMFHNMLNSIMQVPFIDKMVKKIKEYKDAINDTKFMRNLRQVFGMKETIPGTYPNRASPTGFSGYATNGEVGRGTHFNDKQRPFLHDVTNAFKSENQIPFLATVVSALGAGLLTAFTTGSVIKGVIAMFGTGLATALGGLVSGMVPIGVLIGGGIIASMTGSPAVKAIAAVLTTAFGLTMGQVVSDKEINITTGNIIKTMVDGIHMATRALFGSGIFGDKGFGGTLTLIAKLALLFKAGREVIGGAALKLATSPTRAIDRATDYADKFLLGKKIAANENKIATLTADTANRLQTANGYLRNSMQSLAQSRGTGVALTGLTTADTFKNSDAATQRAMMSSMSKQAQDAARVVMKSQEMIAAVQRQAALNPAIIDGLKNNNGEMGKMRDAVSAKISEGNAEAKRSMINGAAAIGGIFGGLGGSNLGSKLAEQMVGYSDWAKIGVQMAGAFIGQGVGAAVGATIASVLIATMTNKFLVIPTLIAGAFYMAYEIWKDPKNFIALITRLEEIGAKWATTFWDEFLKNPYSQYIVEPFAKAKQEVISPDLRAPQEKSLSENAMSGFLGGPVGLLRNVIVGEITYLYDNFGSMLKATKKGAESLLSAVMSSAHASDDIKKNVVAPGSSMTADGNIIPNDIVAKLVDAIRSVETSSKDGPDVTSFKGAKGKMQIIEPTFNGVVAQHKMEGMDFSKEEDRIKVATQHVADLWEKYLNPMKVFAAYNGGPSAVNADGSLNARKTLKDGKEIDNSTSYSLRAMKRFGTSATDKLSQVKDNIMDNPLMKRFTSFMDEMLTKAGFKKTAEQIKADATKESPTGTTEEITADTKVQKTLKEQLTEVGSTEGSIRLINEALDEIGAVHIDERAFSNATDEIIQLVEDYDNWKSLLNSAISKSALFGSGPKRAALDSANAAKKMAKKLSIPDEADPAKIYMPSEDAKKAGTDYATKVQNEFIAGLSTLLKGNGKGVLKSFFKGFVKQLGDTVIDAFSKGLTDSFFKASGLDRMIASVVTTGAFGGEIGGEKSGSGLKAGGGLLSVPMNYLSDKIRLSGTAAGDAWSNGVDRNKDGAFYGSDLVPGENLDPNFVPKATTILDTEALKTSTEVSTEAITEAIGKSTLDLNMGLGDVFTMGMQDIGLKLGSAFEGLTHIFGVMMTPNEIKGPSAFATILRIAGAVVGYAGAGSAVSGLGSASEIAATSNVYADAAGVGSTVASDVGTSTSSMAGGWGTGYDLGAGADFSGATFKVDSPSFDFGTGYATGGLIKGPGTGTSDSVPIMASNHEFMVNARQTKKFRPLLEAINNGEVAKFATGGLIGDASGAASTLSLVAAPPQSPTPSSQQIFNIKITGDISRQTKREIYDMIPQIASGVNAHNRELGK